ncbi:unnamed protein product, partial [Porites evermanni]
MTITLLRNWLLWDFISQCNHSTDSNKLKIYNSPYGNAEKRVEDVQEDIDNANLEEGHFVVLSNYKKRPVIGKVLEF